MRVKNSGKHFTQGGFVALPYKSERKSSLRQEFQEAAQPDFIERELKLPVADYAELEIVRGLMISEGLVTRIVDPETGKKKPDVWAKALDTAQLDTADLRLFKNGLSLRARRERDEHGKWRKPDISTKSLIEHNGSEANHERIELEATLRNFHDLDLNRLFEEYEGQPVCKEHLRSLLEAIDYDPENLRESFLIECDRTNFKVQVFVTENGRTMSRDQLLEDLTISIHTDEELDNEAIRKAQGIKSVVFEFSLDSPNFYEIGPTYPGKNNHAPVKMVFHSDHEIEIELKTEEDMYDKNPLATDSDATLNDIELAENHVKALVTSALRRRRHEKIVWGNKSKAERGTEALMRYRDDLNAHRVAVLNYPTLFGRKTNALPIEDHFLDVESDHESAQDISRARSLALTPAG